MLTCSLFVYMILVNEKMIGEYIERYARQVHFEQTSSFIAAIANETFIAP